MQVLVRCVADAWLKMNEYDNAKEGTEEWQEMGNNFDDDRLQKDVQ